MKKILLITLIAGLAGFVGNPDTPAQEAGFSPPKTGKIPVAIVVTQNANLMDFAGPLEVFGNVRIEGRGHSKSEDPRKDDRYPFDLYIVGDAATPVRLGAGMMLVPQFSFDDAPAPRIVVVGAQMGSPRMKAWLLKTAADPRTDLIMSVCTGAFKLASTGLLDGKPATTHHGYYSEFEKYFPAVKLRKGVRFVRSDAHLFTAGGLTSGIDLALHIVQLYFGQSVAQQTADWMEYQGTGWHAKD
jgi:transcriptional regulator GlxA family with amidase domain